MARVRTQPKETRVGGRLWLEKGEESFLGGGRIELLEKIAEHGSISAAARAIGMSYKAAWEAVDAMNNLADEPLVIRETGGRHGGGTRLTDHGRRIVELFRVIQGEYDRFLGGLSAAIGDFDRFFDLMRRLSFKASVRNQFQGRVLYLVSGAVNSEVVVELSGGDRLVSIVSNESIEQLRLKEGDPVHALVKETSVILLVEEDGAKSSARNKLCGTVVRCQEGAVNGEVVIELAGGRRVTAIITNESIHNLGLKEGAYACALIKASDVILAVSV